MRKSLSAYPVRPEPGQCQLVCGAVVGAQDQLRAGDLGRGERTIRRRHRGHRAQPREVLEGELVGRIRGNHKRLVVQDEPLQRGWCRGVERREP